MKIKKFPSDRIQKTDQPQQHTFILKNGQEVTKTSGSIIPTDLPKDLRVYFPIQDYFDGINGFTIVSTTIGEWKSTIKFIMEIPDENKHHYMKSVLENINKVIPHLDRIYSRMSNSKHARKKWENFCNDVVIMLAYYRIWKKMHLVIFLTEPNFLNNFDPDGVSRSMFFRI